MQGSHLSNEYVFTRLWYWIPALNSNGKELFQSQRKRWVLKWANAPSQPGTEMWATKRLQLTWEGTTPVLCGSLNVQNPIPPFILRAEGLEDCLHSGSIVKTTAYILEDLLLLGNWWICRVFSMLVPIPWAIKHRPHTCTHTAEA